MVVSGCVAGEGVIVEGPIDAVPMIEGTVIEPTPMEAAPVEKPFEPPTPPVVSPSDVTEVTGEQVHVAMGKVHDPENGVKVYAGPDALKAGIEAIMDGKTIDYVGASGPVDYDESGNVLSRIALYEVKGGEFVESTRFDCEAGPDCPVVK